MPAGRHAHSEIGSPAVARVAETLDVFCAEQRLPPEVAWRLRVALDEIVANIVAYGSRGGDGAALDVWFRRKGDQVEVTIADDGPSFDPLSRPAPDVSLPLEARQPGGLGISLVRSLMDEVRYTRTNRNILFIRKHIDATVAGSGAPADADSAE
jgi:anti-sigma regulatory factor (Ser/Thr protein kinase)